jgi:hypothetical protein
VAQLVALVAFLVLGFMASTRFRGQTPGTV